jgi:preprotein translocase subunit SecF
MEGQIMWRKMLSLTLVCLLAELSAAAPVMAKSKAEQEARDAARVRAAIQQLGTGEPARVQLKLRDKTKRKGYVSATSAESFTVTDPQTGTATVVAYPQVKQVKGNNLSTGAKIAIGGAVVVAIIIVAIKLSHWRPLGDFRR